MMISTWIAFLFLLAMTGFYFLLSAFITAHILKQLFPKRQRQAFSSDRMLTAAASGGPAESLPTNCPAA